MDFGDNGYLSELKKRSKESRAYTKHQVMGLEIAQILGDEPHKALYIKLAKNRDANELRRLAQEVAERHNIKNKGAYFMKLLSLKNVSDRKIKR